MGLSDVESRDLDELYRELAPQLRRIVRSNLSAADEVLEDACQFAWTALLTRRGTVTPGLELAWLTTTATREALRLLRVQRRAGSLQDPRLEESAEVADRAAAAPGPQQLAEMHERLGAVTALPLRQQRMVWLQVLGYGYGEISAATGASPRTVERQLGKARRKLAS